MPKKVRKEQVDRIVFLRDTSEWTWDKISEDVKLSLKSCKKHYDQRKELEGKQRIGKVHADAFQIFSQGGNIAEVIQKLQLPIDETEELYRKYYEFTKKELNTQSDNESSLFDNYYLLKMRGVLKKKCENLLFFVKEVLGNLVSDEKELAEVTLQFLIDAVKKAEHISKLNDIGEILKKEERYLGELYDKEYQFYKKNQQRKIDDKKRWIIRRRMDRGMSKSEAELSLKNALKIYKSIDHLYEIEKTLERGRAYNQVIVRRIM